MSVNQGQLLENQLCFALYASSRLVTRLYAPLLEQHNLTYPQYVILLILWQKEGVTVGEIGAQAILNSNTLTPILKRMEALSLIFRQRDEDDERKMCVYLTAKGRQLQQELVCLPSELRSQVKYDDDKAKQLKALLQELMVQLSP